MKEINKEEVWSAIRYLDPDEQRSQYSCHNRNIGSFCLPLAVFGFYFGFG
jgi:hypothetical protein